MAVSVPPWAIRLTLTDTELNRAAREAAGAERDEEELAELPEL
jgi:hypothetical protein